MSHFPRKPVRFIEANEELLDMQKSIAADSRQGHHPDYAGPTEAAFPAKMEPQYRTAPDRVNGNSMFRRYPDGRLDYEYAKYKVVDAIHKVRDGVALTGVDKCALSCLFPGMFGFIDSSMVASTRAVNLKITPEESAKISSMVATHLHHEMQFMLSSHAR